MSGEKYPDRFAVCVDCDWTFAKPGDPSGVGIAALVHHRDTGHTTGYAANWEAARQLARTERTQAHRLRRKEGQGPGGLTCATCDRDLVVSIPGRNIFCRSCGTTYADITAAGQIRWRAGYGLTALDSDKG